jgi:hypothetical protein
LHKIFKNEVTLKSNISQKNEKKLPRNIFPDDKLSVRNSLIEDKHIGGSVNSGKRFKMKKEINIDYLAQMRELREKDVDYKHKNNERTLD